jgi:hypothetical protein
LPLRREALPARGAVQLPRLPLHVTQ